MNLNDYTNFFEDMEEVTHVKIEERDDTVLIVTLRPHTVVDEFKQNIQAKANDMGETLGLYFGGTFTSESSMGTEYTRVRYIYKN